MAWDFGARGVGGFQNDLLLKSSDCSEILRSFCYAGLVRGFSVEKAFIAYAFLLLTFSLAAKKMLKIR